MITWTRNDRGEWDAYEGAVVIATAMIDRPRRNYVVYSSDLFDDYPCGADTLREAKRKVHEAWMAKRGLPLYRPHQPVRISTAVGGFPAHRRGYVVSDEGGPKVKVRWYTAEGPTVSRRLVAYHGHAVEQWIPRERLEAW